ncbi:MAG: hypothetical protein EOP24_32205 [Hyphomicrobiales bacterium]|nr:MAG: hypothetical protein EOP24_32205 [Hyphomicrobiales bacterium]
MRGKNKEQRQAKQFADANGVPNIVGDDRREMRHLPELRDTTPGQRCGGSQGRDSKLQVLLTVLPVLSAALYLVGTIYHESYLKSFGVDNSMFPLPLDRVWLYGFTSLLSFGLGPMLTGVPIAVLVFAVVMIAAVLSSFPRLQGIQTATLEYIRAKLPTVPNKPTPALINFLDKGGVLYFYFAGAFFLVIALVFALLLSSNAGAKAAEGDKAKWAEGAHRTAAVGIEGEPTFTAFQVTCGATHCAFWTGGETRLLRHEQMVSLLVSPAKKTDEKSSK